MHRIERLCARYVLLVGTALLVGLLFWLFGVIQYGARSECIALVAWIRKFLA
jgi:hypothetical protein